MSAAFLAPLFLFVLVATVSPGGATTLATASGINFGVRRSVPLIVGMAGGLPAMAALAAAGLSTLLLGLPVLQVVMKVVGSAYLLWLAFQIGRSGRPDLERGVAKPVSLAGGIGLLWINPKAWAMTLSAAASFVALADGPVRLALLLGATFAVISTVSLVLWCVAGALLARLLRRDAQWRVLNAGLGLLLVASIVPIWL